MNIHDIQVGMIPRCGWRRLPRGRRWREVPGSASPAPRSRRWRGRRTGLRWEGPPWAGQRHVGRRGGCERTSPLGWELRALLGVWVHQNRRGYGRLLVDFRPYECDFPQQVPSLEQHTRFDRNRRDSGAAGCRAELYRAVFVIEPNVAHVAEPGGRGACRWVRRGARRRCGGQLLCPQAGPRAASRAASMPGSCGGTVW